MKKTVKAMREVPILEAVTCDGCGAAVPGRPYADHFTEVVIEFKAGYQCPSGGSIDVETVDVCKACAPKLKALIEAAGFKFSKHDVDF